MKLIWNRFYALHFLLKIIWLFCLIGLLVNSVLLWRDLQQGGVLFRLHIGFWLLYMGQVVFILWGERTVFWLSLLQTILAFMTNLDFTFVPALRIVGRIFLAFGKVSIDGMEVYKYVFVSACFTLELLKTFLLWQLTKPVKTK